VDKKPVRKKKDQFYPFVTTGDRKQPFVVGIEDPSVGDIAWKDFAKGIKRRRGKDSMILSILVSEYQRKAKTEGTDAALAHFWRYQATLSTKSLTEDMVTVLAKANGGDAGATQIIVRACPDAIHLPFIASNMAAVVRTYKYAKVGKRIDGRDAYLEDEEVTEREALLKEFRKENWDAFLPKRTGGDLPYAAEDLARVVKKARQQKERNEHDLYTEIGKELNISSDVIKKKVKIKNGRGRPRK